MKRPDSPAASKQEWIDSHMSRVRELALESASGFSKGDRVCVHGQGHGRIVEVVPRDEYPGPYVVVEIPRADYHKASRRKIEWTERVSVLLDVYPPHLTRSAV